MEGGKFRFQQRNGNRRVRHVGPHEDSRHPGIPQLARSGRQADIQAARALADRLRTESVPSRQLRQDAMTAWAFAEPLLRYLAPNVIGCDTVSLVFPHETTFS